MKTWKIDLNGRSYDEEDLKWFIEWHRNMKSLNNLPQAKLENNNDLLNKTQPNAQVL